MNCKFCGNFVPDGTDSCPVCGRRPSEEAMGKLLSDNQPSNFVPSSAALPAADSDNTKSKKEKKNKEPKKGLLAPLIAIAASAAGGFFAWTQGIVDTIKTIFNDVSGNGAQLGEGSSYSEGAAASAFGEAGQTAALIIGAAALVVIVGVVGIIVLFKRLINRAKD